MKEKLYSKKAPNPIGPYSQAIVCDNLIFTSGQIALNTEGVLVSEGIKEQTRQVIINLKGILEDNRSSLNQVIKTIVFLKDINEFSEMNEVYGEYFNESQPARSTVEVCRLPKGAKVMIEVIAFR